MRRILSAVAKGAVGLLAVWHAGTGAVDWLGRLDFVVQHAGWVAVIGAGMQWLWNAPAWVGPAGLLTLGVWWRVNKWRERRTVLRSPDTTPFIVGPTPSQLAGYEHPLSSANSPNGLLALGQRTDLVLLRSLARVAYGKLGPCGFRSSIDSRAPFPPDRVNITARIIAADATLLGVHPPAREWEEIPADEAARMVFRMGENALDEPDGTLAYTGVSVRVADVDDAIAAVLAQRDRAPSEIGQPDTLKPEHG